MAGALIVRSSRPGKKPRRSLTTICGFLDNPQHRDFDVLLGRQSGQQVKSLKDKADTFGPYLGPLPLGKIFMAFKKDSPGGGDKTP